MIPHVFDPASTSLEYALRLSIAALLPPSLRLPSVLSVAVDCSSLSSLAGGAVGLQPSLYGTHGGEYGGPRDLHGSNSGSGIYGSHGGYRNGYGPGPGGMQGGMYSSAGGRYF